MEAEENMILFPEALLSVLIYGALGLTVLGLLTLLFMVVRDYKQKNIW